MAGCIKDREVWEISYKAKKQEIHDLHPELPQDEVNKIAFGIFLNLYRQDYRSAREEEKNLPETIGPDFRLNSEGKVYYPQYGGQSLESLHERQRKLMPGEYSPTDHQTSRAIDAAFASGATTIITSYAREGLDNRDIVVMTYDPDTGIGKTKIINSAVDKNYHSFEGIKIIARTLKGGMHEVDPSSSVFILTDKPVSEIKVRQAVAGLRPDSITAVTRSVSSDVARAVSVSLYHSSKDIMLTAGTVIQYIEQQKKRKKEAKLSQSKTEIKRRIVKPRRENVMKKAREVIISNLRQIKKYQLAEKIINNLRDYQVGLGGFIWAIRILNYKPEVRKITDIKEKVKIKKSEIFIRKAQKTEKVKSRILKSDKLPKIIKNETGNVQINKNINTEVKDIKRFKDIVLSPAKLSKKLDFLLSLIKSIRAAKLFREFKPDVKKIKPVKNENISPPAAEDRMPKKETKFIRKLINIQITFILWTIIRHPGILNKTTKAKEDKITIDLKETDSRDGNYLLAAIIWYLAQIREQGFVTKKKPLKQIKKKSDTILSSGIIFQYMPAVIHT